MTGRGGGPQAHTQGGAKGAQAQPGPRPLRYVTMGILYLLAQQAPSIWSPGNVLIAILTVAAAFAIVGGIAAVLARGFWSKTIEPMIQAAIVSWYSSEDQGKARQAHFDQAIQAWYGKQTQVEARKVETTGVVTAWHTSPEQMKVRKEFVRDEIDNHVRRDDGLIHKEIKMSVERGVQPLHQDMADIKNLLQQRSQEDLLFREQVIGKLGHLEGLLARSSPLRAETPVHTPSRPSFPQHPFPQPPVKPPQRGPGQ